MMPINRLNRCKNPGLLCNKLRMFEMMLTSETLMQAAVINTFIIQFPLYLNESSNPIKIFSANREKI